MQPSTLTNNNAIKRITQKEFTIFFASPLAYIFLIAFVGLCFFAVFWGEAFFARNIADVRPLFEWMPLMLIFLCGALTMRMWSEEKRTGTLEFVITVPIATWQFVIGKFLACVGLLAVALALTLVLPLSISFIANLDWGPIFSAYLATLLLGAAYIAIGLYVSSRSDNQIVSLMMTCLLCGVFYFIGSDLLVNLFNFAIGDYLRLLGTGSRFESITRGVIDVRDLYYYLSLAAVFLCLNIYTLEKSRWSEQGKGESRKSDHQQWSIITGMAVINLLMINIWLQPISKMRLDMTEGEIYSISEASENYLEQLQEPLLIRGYFSEKTHPLLAPLVPQIRDLLKEYEVSGAGKVRTEFIDPIKHPELEEEASSKFGIKPVPFQVADRYQAAVVNSYFDIVIQYGDEFEKLGFRDLIEIKQQVDTDIDVQLRNPEYDITRSIKKVLYSYQSGGKLFDSIQKPIQLTAYVSDDALLPDSLATLKKNMIPVLDKMNNIAGKQFDFSFVDPEANGGQIAQQIAEQYGFSPMASSLFSSERFYFYMVLNDGKQAVQIPLPEGFSAEQFEQLLNAGIKRFATGFMKTIGLFAANNRYTGKTYDELQAAWSENYKVEDIDLLNGVVPGHIDILAVISPDNISDKQLFAIDQFLMQGGTVIMASSPYNVSLSNYSLMANKHDSGVKDWLAHHGVSMEEAFVMDKQNAAFPVPVQRRVGPITVQEMQIVDYPFFVDIRENGLDQNNMMTSGLIQLTMPWASPLAIDNNKNQSRKVEELLYSSDESWRSTATDLLPNVDESFLNNGNYQKELLGASISGEFTSYFAEKDSPLFKQSEAENGEDVSNETVVSSVIKKSAESAKLIIFSSAELVNDQTLHVAGMATGTKYLNSVQLLINAVEWSLEDTGLLSIRSRSHFSRTLPPIENNEQLMLEVGNYIVAILLVFMIYGIRRYQENIKYRRYQNILAEGV